jgi:hypothetical protein
MNSEGARSHSEALAVPLMVSAGVTEPLDVALADSGYWHQEQMDQLAGDGIQVLIPPDAAKRTGTRPGWDGGRYSWMRHLLASELGGGLYRRRSPTIEPVFAQIQFNRKIDRFQRRGRAAVRSEWRLAAETHNLLKLHNHQTPPRSLKGLQGDPFAATAAITPPTPPAPVPAKRLCPTATVDTSSLGSGPKRVPSAAARAIPGDRVSGFAELAEAFFRSMCSSWPGHGHS